MSHVCGIDVGSLSTKAVIMKDREIIAWDLILTRPDSMGSAQEILSKVLRKADLNKNALSYIIATGYGRVNVPFSNLTLTEISCHARGAGWFFPGVRTILDMGGQDCKVIRCNSDHRVVRFEMNDKCAAGTGRYLERIAATVGVPLDKMGEMSLQNVRYPSKIKSYCAVFAENEVLVLLRQGAKINDVLAGASEAIVKRIVSLLGRVGIESELAFSGGVAKNIGIVKRLEAELDMEIMIATEPQIIGAVGAAMYATDYLKKELEKTDRRVLNA